MILVTDLTQMPMNLERLHNLINCFRKLKQFIKDKEIGRCPALLGTSIVLFIVPCANRHKTQGDQIAYTYT